MKGRRQVKLRENLDEAAGESKSSSETELEKPKLCCSVRLLFTAACFIATFNVSYIRVGISMALICMVAPRQNREDDKRTGEFDWSSPTKGYLISAAFYGFILGPLVAGFLSFKFGGKIIMIIGTMAAGASNFLIPETTRITPILLFVIRVVIGFFCGFTFPAYYDLASHWIVPEERQLLVTAALVGIPVANILNFPINTFICDWLGWVWIFYTLAIWLILCGIIFCFILFNDPEKCPFASEKEVRYLKTKIPKRVKHKIPWKAIAKSLPIYAYIIMHFSVNYIYLNLIISLPVVMENVHHFPLQANGLLSAVPFIGALILRVLIGLFFEKLRLKLKLSKNALRKIFVSIGAVLVSLSFLTLTFLSCRYRYWVLTCFILASTSLELCLTGGYLLSLLDLCPSYVNIITGFANAIGNVAGLVSPVVNGLITTHGTREEWNKVFYINISIMLASTVFYLAFGQNHLQHWDLVAMPSAPTHPRASTVG